MLDNLLKEKGFTQKGYGKNITYTNGNIKINKHQIPNGNLRDKATKTAWSLWVGCNCLEFNTTKVKVEKALRKYLEE